jgi:hypothetical protein
VPSLVYELTDLQGTVVAGIEDRNSSKVEVHKNGIGRGEVTISLEDSAVVEVKPAERRLRSFLDGRCILNGPLLLPQYKFADGVVTINAASPGAQLERRFIKPATPKWKTYGLELPQTDQGQILRKLVDHARPTAAEVAMGTPDHGIGIGSIPATRKRDRNYEPGKQIWEAMIELTGVRGGPDFELVPVKSDDGTCCLLNVYASQGSDKTDTVVFTYGIQEANCRDFSYEPDAGLLENRFTSMGQSETGGPPPYYIANQIESQKRFGIWEGFEGRPDISDAPTVQEHAQGNVAAYAYPPQNFDISPAIEGDEEQYGTPPQFGKDYWIGDIARSIAKKGNITLDLIGRLTDAVLEEPDQSGERTLDLTFDPLSVAGVV